MITISLCMIVRNEQDTLERCLESIRSVVDEIVIVDTGSTDQTKEIAGKYTGPVFDFKWIDDFAAARNFSFAQATMDYILWLDADDVLLADAHQKLHRLKQTLDPEVDVVSMDYHCAFDQQGEPNLIVRRNRLVKRSKNYQWQGAVHEDLVINRDCLLDSDIAITHKQVHGPSDRNLKIYERLLLAGRPLSPRDIFHYARELHHHQMHEKAIEFYLQCMEFSELSAEDKIFVCGKLTDCYYFLGEKEKEWASIWRSFEYDVPRPEFCCRLGYHFLQGQKIEQAIFWYKLAADAPTPQNRWAILNHASRTWLPHMQLAHCYYELGKYELSYEHNLIALSHQPDNEQIQNNIKLLENILQPLNAR
ncbi:MULTISPECIES: tetratricopeptide repeat-containing glycosyltransferase family 2 protein [unclassified Paenibacillus]|uniref:tetratricopeptide repeat-containing glycosyltransferase family 2 protein n=1 Tax=unclassified Paenibacillus TaxID=185978 RepID=UPI003643B3D4